MSITSGDILKIVGILSWLDGDIMQNVFNAVLTGGGSPWDDQDVADDALNWLDTIFTNLDSSQADTLDGSEVITYVYDAIDDDWDEVGSADWNHNPTIAVEELPRGIAALVNCKTSDPDVNGKKYFGGLTESSSEDGLWNAAELARLALAAADWIAPFVGATSGATWTPGVWSPTHTVFKQMSGTIIIPAIPAYQRRRKQGVGI